MDGWPPWREIALVAGFGVLCLVLWFVPEYLGSGDWLRAAERARDPNPDSAAFASSPFVEVFRRSAAVLSAPVYVGAVIAVAFAFWRRDRMRLALAAMATVLMIAVAAMTQGGFAGNLRYVALPAALVCVLAGAGWVELVRGARRWGPLVAAVLAVAAIPFVNADLDKLKDDRALTCCESDFYGPNLKAVIAKAGGEDAIKSCGDVFSGPFQVPSVAWRLHLHADQVEIFAFGPGTALSMGATHLSVDPRYPEITKTRHWVVGSSCGRGYSQPMAAAAPRPAWNLGSVTRARLLPLGLAALMLLSLALRTTELGIGFWIDEGLSVGISDRPLGDIPAACGSTARRRSTTCCCTSG